MGIACQTRPEADTNIRNDAVSTAMKCPFCRSEVSGPLRDAISERMDALVSRPVHEAEFRMSRTTDAKRFFDGEVSASEDDVAGWFHDTCTSTEVAEQLLDILTNRSIMLAQNGIAADTTLDSPIPPTRDAHQENGSVCDRLIRKVQNISRRIYRSGHITPCFIYNLHQAGYPVGGDKALGEARSIMASNSVGEAEVRAVRRALESIAESRRAAVMQYAGSGLYVTSFPLQSVGQVRRRRIRPANQSGPHRLVLGTARPPTPP